MDGTAPPAGSTAQDELFGDDRRWLQFMINVFASKPHMAPDELASALHTVLEHCRARSELPFGACRRSHSASGATRGLGQARWQGEAGEVRHFREAIRARGQDHRVWKGW